MKCGKPACKNADLITVFSLYSFEFNLLEGIMKKGASRQNSKETLHFREIGKGFIIVRGPDQVLSGRRLTKSFVDQFNRTYVLVNGELELVTEGHCFLDA